MKIIMPVTKKIRNYSLSLLNKYKEIEIHAGLHLGFFSRGGKIAVFAYHGGGGRKRYMLYITIYI